MKVLVANRGEIAARILRTLRAEGIASVAVFAPEDEQPLHVVRADEAIALEQRGAYLDGRALVAAAKRTGATHIHPGYGFLSQSPQFVQMCAAEKLTFIGPSAAAMQLLGDKRASRMLAQKHDISVVPGASAADDVEAVVQVGAKLGYPLLLKAAGSGGGRGMRAVFRKEEIAPAFAAATREAERTSGDARLLVEQLVYPARHIEVQVAGDGRDARALGIRECSLQRRYQKVIEEAPTASVPADVVQKLFCAAEKLACAAQYCGLLTVEFLFTQEGRFYFLEVNPRLQVEHPVTEMTLQVDLVALQLLLCEGIKLTDVPEYAPRGHAIEVRVIAEDAAAGYMPQTGRIGPCEWPQGPFVRVDAGVAEGSCVTPHFDSLLGKIIAWGESREQARRRLLGALDETLVTGVQHNLPLLRRLLSSERFARGETFIHELDETPFVPAPAPAAAGAAIAGLVALHAPADTSRASAPKFPGPWHARGAKR